MSEKSNATPQPATRGYRIDQARERLIVLRRLLPWLEQRTGERMHRSVVYRWVQRGLEAADGSRVRLPTTRIGAIRATSEEAFAWWSARLAGEDGEVAAARAAVAGNVGQDASRMGRASGRDGGR